MGYRACLQAISPDHYSGVAPWTHSMAKIVLPLSMPGILSAGIFSFTLSWNECLYGLCSSPHHSKRPFPLVW